VCGGLAFEWIPRQEWIFFDQAIGYAVYGTHNLVNCTANNAILIGTDRTNVFKRTWWSDYIDKAQTIIDKRPCGKALVEAEAMRDQALLEASTCAFCKPRAAADLRAFIAVYAAAVDTAVGKVILQIK